MIEIFETKWMSDHKPHYVWNCDHYDIKNMSVSTSFASTYVHQFSRCQIHSVIRFFVTKNKTQTEVFWKFEFVMNKDKVRTWVREFWEKELDVHDEQKSPFTFFLSKSTLHSLNSRTYFLTLSLLISHHTFLIHRFKFSKNFDWGFTLCDKKKKSEKQNKFRTGKIVVQWWRQSM